MTLVPPCFTVFTVCCGLNSLFGDRLTTFLQPLDPKRTILLSSNHKLLHLFTLGQSMCFLANFNLFAGGFLPLITLELITAFAILRFIQMVFFFLFIPHPSGFNCHFKAFQIIFCSSSFLFFFSVFYPLQSTYESKYIVPLNNIWTNRFYSDFQREMHHNQHVQHLMPTSLDKGHLLNTCFLT